MFDQVEAHLVGTDVRVVFQGAAHQLAHLRNGLDTGKAGADHNEGEELALDFGIGRHIGRLQAADDVGTQAMGVRQVLHGERVLGQPGEALQIDAGAERDHQLVIGEIDRNTPRTLHHGDRLPWRNRCP